ncbi:hypothetical protein UFOVP27_39 [uncultured Caudovirales phage]|uniref:Uncharacterized protein n=1 Tax=uncultured Caudovirales phage TaxID=2100421 RepID=A0A6J5KMF6_9CAUD|nr:hypothetical protein UFOVP27_39 [uncultured Caudovirales phage]
MKFLPRREDNDARKAKASRATENSIGKHQSAMDAIHLATGGNSSSARFGGSSREEAEGFHDKSGTYYRGAGHVKVLDKDSE